RRRIATLRTLARALADGTIDLGPGTDRDEAARALLALPGIGPWSVGYIRMRALGDPDVLLASDLGVRKALDALPVPLTDGQLAAARPWRSYLTHLLWAAHAGSVHR
ncbi:DNA-3-methyladenine glycosylase 2 family protein, partial [Burkholderia multivorans]